MVWMNSTNLGNFTCQDTIYEGDIFANWMGWEERMMYGGMLCGFSLCSGVVFVCCSC